MRKSLQTMHMQKLHKNNIEVNLAFLNTFELATNFEIQTVFADHKLCTLTERPLNDLKFEYINPLSKVDDAFNKHLHTFFLENLELNKQNK